MTFSPSSEVRLDLGQVWVRFNLGLSQVSCQVQVRFKLGQVSSRKLRRKCQKFQMMATFLPIISPQLRLSQVYTQVSSRKLRFTYDFFANNFPTAQVKLCQVSLSWVNRYLGLLTYFKKSQIYQILTNFSPIISHSLQFSAQYLHKTELFGAKTRKNYALKTQ